MTLQVSASNAAHCASANQEAQWAALKTETCNVIMTLRSTLGTRKSNIWIYPYFLLSGSDWNNPDIKKRLRSSLVSSQVSLLIVVKMKLILAISVVFIALSVLAGPTSAESEDSAVKEKFTKFGEAIKEAAARAGEKIKNTYEDIRDSEAMTKTKNFFSSSFKQIKDAFTKN
ncbi:apolipoprotein C-I [Hyperolius riggenbachi]|uniref:apolipoprotein C-I n=1 Tax=Hyperolius riggenbachi TaxID=752182 RepID=UPI0035A35227